MSIRERVMSGAPSQSGGSIPGQPEVFKTWTPGARHGEHVYGFFSSGFSTGMSVAAMILEPLVVG